MTAYNDRHQHIRNTSSKRPRPLADTLAWLAHDQSGGGTAAPEAGVKIAQEMLKARADRRVLIVLCDEDYNPGNVLWADIARRGIELWGIQLAENPNEPWTVSRGVASWAHRYSTGSAALALNWARELRQHVGRVSV